MGMPTQTQLKPAKTVEIEPESAVPSAVVAVDPTREGGGRATTPPGNEMFGPETP